MSLSSTPVTVTLHDNQGEVEIIGRDFRVVRRGFGSVSADLPPGIYKARARIGGTQSEELFVVETEGQPLHVRMLPVEFPSAVPLNRTSTSHEYHQEAITAATTSVAEDVGLGIGAKLLIVVRDPSTANFRRTKSASAAENYDRSFKGFRLRSVTGDLLVDLDAQANRDPDKGYLLLSAHANPEQYVLTFERAESEPLAMPVYAVAGWQSQVFISLNVPEAIDSIGQPLLADRALLMAPMGHAFHPDDYYLRLTEICRVGLQQGRTTTTGAEIGQILDEKFFSPVLGLLGAHILLLDEAPDTVLLGVVIRNTAKILGENFPDVAALRLALSRLTSTPSGVPGSVDLFVPPLLRASWDLIANDAHRMKPGSLTRAIAPNVVSNGIWLGWKPSWKPSHSTWANRSDFENAISARHAEVPLGRPASGMTPESSDVGLGAAAGSADELALPEKQKRRARRRKRVIPQDEAQIVAKSLVELASAYDLERLLSRSRHTRGALAGDLTELQKQLLPTVQLIRYQLSEGESFTVADLNQLREGLRVPLPLLHESVNDLHLRLPRYTSLSTWRRALAVTGWALFVLPMVAMVLRGVPLQASMSAYYHASDGVVRHLFVGATIAIAVFLYLYKGYSRAENYALNLAGLFAIGVAVLPDKWECAAAACKQFSLHGTAAVLFFLCIAYVCWFRAPDTLSLLYDKKQIARYKATYRTLAAVMVASPAAAVIANAVLQGPGQPLSRVFFIEAMAVSAFFTYWFAKSAEVRTTNADRLLLKGKAIRVKVPNRHSRPLTS